MIERKPREVAERYLAEFERSGYGTERPDRWTPQVSPEDAVALARAVLAADDERRV